MKISAAFAFLMALQPVAGFTGLATKSGSNTVLYAGLPTKHSDNKELQNIFYQNQAWKTNKLVEDPAFFEKLGSIHVPDFMWIGKCTL
jgi:hypothetical protein